MTACNPTRARLRRGGRGQTLVEFALVAPILLLIFFAVLEGSLLVFTMGAFRYAASQGAIQVAEQGNATSADTQAVQVIRSAPGVTGLASVTEVDIYHLIAQSNGTFTVDTNEYNKYNLDGSAISVTWSPSVRNVRNGFTDYFGVSIQYQYQWKSGTLLGSKPLQLTQTIYARLEPESY